VGLPNVMLLPGPLVAVGGVFDRTRRGPIRWWNQSPFCCLRIPGRSSFFPEAAGRVATIFGEPPCHRFPSFVSTIGLPSRKS
jgi:hypothetical protein